MPSTSLLVTSFTLKQSRGGGHATARRLATVRNCASARYMVDEAKLVSSCLSLPSRARPLFSRFLSSVGVRVYTLQKVELDDTWSLWDDTLHQSHGPESPTPSELSL